MISENLKGFKCLRCGKEFSLKQARYQCPDCSGNLEAVYDYARIGRKADAVKNSAEKGIYRYLPFFPFADTKLTPPLLVGGTPLVKSDRLSSKWGVELFFKDDTRNPSASFKDRAGAVALTVAREDGLDRISCASTGNAGSSLACLAASVGMGCIIFVPEKAPQAKIAQLLLFGAKVFAVQGTYDEAFDLCACVSTEIGCFNRSTGLNPWTREGKKTVSFEIAEDLGWEVPDYVFVPVGDGNIISGVWKGFRELFYAGFTQSIPKIVAVQSKNSDAVHKTLEKYKGKDVSPEEIEMIQVNATTIADSISVDVPRDGLAAVRAVRETDGFSVEISDEAILEAIKEISSNTGLFPEPAGATAYAGLKKALEDRKVKAGSRIVCLVTGSGLKDVASALKAAGKPISVSTDKAETLEILCGK
ncbi:MAG: threonine synthase [Elusimicrobia bacterium HGW-Elusimicrobia-2]|nr:MAG: threonine synthase [Elusimicrobia bacterium HGW-Elusimicrobia-2]